MRTSAAKVPAVSTRRRLHRSSVRWPAEVSPLKGDRRGECSPDGTCTGVPPHLADARNLASRQAIVRIGAREEGVWRSHMVMRDGFIRDSVMHTITRTD